MAKKEDNNFKKAMNELLGYGEAQTQTAAKAQETVREPQESVYEEKSTGFAGAQVLKTAEPQTRREEALIPSDMMITGNISTKSDMKIYGSIVGDVECEGSIVLVGNIQGNVSASNLTLQKGGLTGDAAVAENVILEENAVLKGNLSAHNVRSNARSEGEIHAEGAVELMGQAVVQGNIAAGSLSVSSGAKIRGMVNVSE